MKQRISMEQLIELTDAQNDHLRKWWKPQEGDQAVCQYGVFTVHKKDDEDEMIWCDCGYSLPPDEPIPLLSVGQMIEILEHGNPHMQLIRRDKVWQIDYMEHDHKAWYELCDCLWDAVKLSLDTPIQILPKATESTEILSEAEAVTLSLNRMEDK